MATMSQISLAERRQATRSERSPAWRRPSREATWLWLAVIGFVGVSVWYFTQDDRVPIWDQGSHLNSAWVYGVALAHGHYLEWFTSYTTYPPLVHLVGAVVYLIGGMHPMAMEMAANILFVPCLAFGCYGVGRELGGPRAGLLAGVVGLGTPMFVSMMHGFYVDTPQAAVIAVALWALLASRRFERFWIAALAGFLCAMAMLVKETSLLFLAGPVAVIVLRGGWRRRGVLAFFALALGLGLPWYVYHWSQLTGTFNAASAASLPVIGPSRFSWASISWYFWNLVNQEVLLPFTVLFAVGVAAGLARIWRRRLASEAIGVRRWIRPWLPADEVLPELLVGALVAYVGITYVGLKDPRYSLPGLVYVAALAVFWIPALRIGWLRTGLSVAVVALAVFFFVGMSFGIGTDARVDLTLPGQSHAVAAENFPGRLTVYEDTGWLRGPPAHDGDVLALLKGLHRLGIVYVTVNMQDDGPDFSFDGINPLAPTAGLVMTAAPLNIAHSADLFLHTPTPRGLAPCQRMAGDNGIYVVEGNTTGLDAQTLSNPKAPHQRYEFVCPGRVPVLWPRG